MRLRYLLPLAVTAGLLAGCGGSSSGSSNGTTSGQGAPSPAKTAFVSRLNSLCHQANAAFTAAPATPRAEAKVVAHFITLFRKVPAPPQLQKLYSSYVSVLEQELAALKRGNTKAMFNIASSRARPLITEIGARGCLTNR